METAWSKLKCFIPDLIGQFLINNDTPHVRTKIHTRLSIYHESSTIFIITTIRYFNVLYLGLFHVWLRFVNSAFKELTELN